MTTTSTTEIVDTFIRRMNNGELVFDDKKAREIRYEMWANDGKKKKETRSFADAFSRALADYTFYKDIQDSYLPVKTNLAFLWINKCFILNIVKEGPALLRQLEEARHENELLRKEIDTLSQRLAMLEAERDQLGKVAQVGDVGE